MTTTQLNMIREGVFSTAIRNMGSGNSRATDRADNPRHRVAKDPG